MANLPMGGCVTPVSIMPDVWDPLRLHLDQKDLLKIGQRTAELWPTSETRLGCGTKSMLTYPAAEIIKLFEIICNNALILRQMADQT